MHAPEAARAAPPPGSLTQLSGPYGCFSEGGTEGCATGRGLRGAASVTVSPDGRDVYVASNNSSAVASFRRSLRTGLLLPAACQTAYPFAGCRAGRGLVGAFSTAISPDGRNLYVASARTIAVFARDRASGRLTQLGGTSACVSQEVAEGCAIGRGLASAAAIEVSRDGRSVYVASVLSNAVAVFARDGATGAIRQLPGAAGCISQGGTEGCTPGRALGGAFSVAVSPEGRHVYATALNSNSISVFRRSPDGALHQLAGTDGCTSATGAEGCAAGRGLGAPNDVTVSGDGRNVYVGSSGSGAVAAFARERTIGNLLQTGGALGCTSQGGIEECSTGRALGGAFSVAMSPDDDNAYAVSSTGVVSLFRNRANGSLTEFPDPDVCTTQGGTENCGTGRALREASSVAVSPDGDNAYVASYRSNAVAVFARNPQRVRMRIRVRGVPRRCVGRRAFRARVAVKSTLPLHRVRVHLDRRRIGTRKGTRRLTVRVRPARLKRGRHRLRIRARDIAGHEARRSVRFRRCGQPKPLAARPRR